MPSPDNRNPPSESKEFTTPVPEHGASLTFPANMAPFNLEKMLERLSPYGKVAHVINCSNPEGTVLLIKHHEVTAGAVQTIAKSRVGFSELLRHQTELYRAVLAILKLEPRTRIILSALDTGLEQMVKIPAVAAILKRSNEINPLAADNDLDNRLLREVEQSMQVSPEHYFLTIRCMDASLRLISHSLLSESPQTIVPGKLPNLESRARLQVIHEDLRKLLKGETPSEAILEEYCDKWRAHLISYDHQLHGHIARVISENSSLSVPAVFLGSPHQFITGDLDASISPAPLEQFVLTHNAVIFEPYGYSPLLTKNLYSFEQVNYGNFTAQTLAEFLRRIRKN